MNDSRADYFYILGTIIFTVYGQLILKWRMNFYGSLPHPFIDKLKFMINVFLDPWIISGFAGAFIASLTWMAAMSKFELTHAYPFMSLNFAIVLVLSAFLLSEQVTTQKIIGIAFIMLGTCVAARG